MSKVKEVGYKEAFIIYVYIPYAIAEKAYSDLLSEGYPVSMKDEGDQHKVSIMVNPETCTAGFKLLLKYTI